MQKMTAMCNFPTDCGNAPKKKMLEQFYLALAHEKLDEVVPFLSKDFCWTMVAQNNSFEKNAFKTAFKNHPLYKLKSLQIDTIITHGAHASVSGKFITMTDDTYEFCDVIKFQTAAAKAIFSIRSFIYKMN